MKLNEDLIDVVTALVAEGWRPGPDGEGAHAMFTRIVDLKEWSIHLGQRVDHTITAVIHYPEGDDDQFISWEGHDVAMLARIVWALTGSLEHLAVPAASPRHSE